MQSIQSAIVWLYWIVCFLIFFVLVAVLYVLTLPFDRFNRIPNKILKALGWLMLKPVPGWSFEIKGADINKLERPAIVVANHQSFLDMPLLYLLPWSMKWVAKKSLFKIPILGWIIFMTGHLGIDRESRKSVKKLDKLVKPIKNGIPGMIFPEGTRTRDGELKPFKNGAFTLAERYNFHILPIVLNGGFEAMRSGSWVINFRQKFTISVLDPLNPQDFESAGQLKQTTYQIIEKELQAVRNS